MFLFLHASGFSKLTFKRCVGRDSLSPSGDRLPNETTKADQSDHVCVCKCMFNINFPDFNVIYNFEREKTKTNLVLVSLKKKDVFHVETLNSFCNQFVGFLFILYLVHFSCQQDTLDSLTYVDLSVDASFSLSTLVVLVPVFALFNASACASSMYAKLL